MTETCDRIDRYVVISSDTHAGAELREYKEYLNADWHERFDAWADSYAPRSATRSFRTCRRSSSRATRNS